LTDYYLDLFRPQVSQQII